MKARYRLTVYIIALVLSAGLAVAVVFGGVTEDQIVKVFALAGTFFTAASSLLALVNITPDP